MVTQRAGGIVGIIVPLVVLKTVTKQLEPKKRKRKRKSKKKKGWLRKRKDVNGKSLKTNSHIHKNGN